MAKNCDKSEEVRARRLTQRWKRRQEPKGDYLTPPPQIPQPFREKWMYSIEFEHQKWNYLPYNIKLKQLLRLIVCRVSLNTGWLVMLHSPYLSHLREIADGSRRAIATKQNLCCLCLALYGYAHAPAAYSNVATNTTGILCTIGVHALAVFHQPSQSLWLFIGFHNITEHL